MKRILMLNSQRYPEDFNSIELAIDDKKEKIQSIEKRLLWAIHQFNPKLTVDQIVYESADRLTDQFPNYTKGVRDGLLVEEFEISPLLASRYAEDGNYVFFRDTICYCRRILMYIFMSTPTEGSRNSFVSQVIFPSLLDYAEKYLSSPSYTFANHRFCFINVVNKTFTSNTIIGNLSLLCALGMDYIDLFDKNKAINRNQIPTTLKEFVQKYMSKDDFMQNYDSTSCVYDNEYYKIDFLKKQFIWETQAMIKTCIKPNPNGSGVNFDGSKEKFYWMEIFPLSLLAYNQGYQVDYSEYARFIKEYKEKFGDKSKKFLRCEILLKYIEKYFI